MTVPTRYIFAFKVVSVEERKEKLNYRKDPDNPAEVVYDERSLGWYVRLENSSAIGPFPDKPNFEPGTVLRSTWEVA